MLGEAFYNIINERAEISLKSYETYDILIHKKVTIYYINIFKSIENQVVINITKEQFEKKKKLGFHAVNL